MPVSFAESISIPAEVLIANFCLRFRLLLFGLACLTTIAILVFRPERNEDQTIESMFAMDDELHASYQALKRIFGGNEVILVVYRDPDLMSPVGLARQQRLCERLNKVSGIGGQVIGIAPLIEMIEGLDVDRFGGMLQLAGFDLSTELLLRQAKELFVGFTHSRDEQTAAVIVLLEAKETSEIPRGEIVDSLKRAIAEARRDLDLPEEILMVGEPVMVADGFRMITEDGLRLGWVATISLSLVVLIAFRSIRWTLIPAAVVQFSLLANDAAVAVMNIQVTIVGSMSTSIITVIAVSTTIHLIIRIRRNLGQDEDYPTAVENAFRQLANPISFACLTDAVGFGALWLAELEPVRDFATVMVVGSLLVLVAFWSIVPTLALFRFCDRVPFWNLQTERTGLHRAFSQGLSLPLRFSRRHPYLVLVSASGILLFSLIGITRNTIESDFTRNFRPGSKIVASYEFVEENLGGAGVWDVLVPAPAKLNPEFLKNVSDLQDRLRTEVKLEGPAGTLPSAGQEQQQEAGGQQPAGLTKVLSLVDAIEAFANKPIEQLTTGHLAVGLSLFEARMPAFKTSLYSEDPDHPGQYFYRIMLRSRERATSEQKKQIIRQVNSICEKAFPARDSEVETIRTTGFYVLLTYMIDSVIRDQWTTFGAAAVGIILMLIVSLGDVRLALVGLVPNLLPILLLLGLFGWANVPINLGIALIAAVSIGLSIDSSIHYIHDFQQRRKSHSVLRSIELAQDQVGRALVYSTFALVVGFSSLCVSEFLPTVYFGGTAMIAMIGGLLGNLFLLPLFIGIIFRREIG